jgi:hypothetical protein
MALSPLQTALDRWKSIWDARRHEPDLSIAVEAWQEQGFSKNADEFWLLAIASLNEIQFSRKASNQTAKSHSLDDSSMSLVTALMLGMELK